MNGPEYAGRSIDIRPVTAAEIAAVRQRCSRMADGTDMLEALGIGGRIDILTTEDVA